MRGIGCDEAQGFLLGRPMPASDVHKHLQQENATNITRHRSAMRTGAFRTMTQPVRQNTLSGVYR